jgi:hypothetical protein
MRLRFPHSAKFAGALAVTIIVFFLCPSAGEEAQAAPPFAKGLESKVSQVTQIRIYRRGRPPIYPYYYYPGRPGVYSFYFGFVPYAKGDYGTQALQRSLYPQDIEWPPSMYLYGPRPGWGPKRPD